MRLSTLTRDKMRFLQGILIGILLLSGLTGKGDFHVHGSYDLDKDGHEETLILNAFAQSAVWVEITKSSPIDTLWSFTLPQGQIFNDAEIVDIDSDGYYDMVAVVDLFPSTKNQVWLYVFLGHADGFVADPLVLSSRSLGFNIVRPSNLSLVPGGSPQLSVAFGATIRQSMVFDIDITDNNISLLNVQMLIAPIISNGYGLVYTGGFTSNGGQYIATLSPENNQLKTAIFDVEQNFKLIQSSLIELGHVQHLLGADIQEFRSKRSNKNGLLVPFGSNDIFLLEVNSGKTTLFNTSLSGAGAFPILDKKAQSNIGDILIKRRDAEIYTTEPVLSHTLPSSRTERKQLSPPMPPLVDEVSTLKPIAMYNDQDLTSLPDGINQFYGAKNEQVNNQVKYDSLAPTLGDFLASVKKDKIEESSDIKRVAVPIMNKEMESVTWADEAGFTQLNLGEYISKETENDSIISPIPEKDKGLSTFTKTVQEALIPSIVDIDTTLDMQSDNEIDLYYVLAMTPASDTKDRYIFDGEAPFGVAVNQVPPMGKATHFQHGVSANLANLKRGEAYDFAYSLRDARLDSITTLTMVHDMQTNVVFMSISPTDDSLSQSYQPEAFDPKLFEFPNYFFEGFPTSLDMDFTDKLIRFSFDGLEDSTYQGIYLSSTTPSIPSQSLAVFMDEGTLQAVRGEVIVRANGSKKVTTEFDLVGTVEPAVMFSRLIQELFPNELKIKLLQGASLEEPLFGPAGKLPKITREPRLPDAEPAQVNPEIPIEPKQSNVPEELEISTKDQSITGSKTSDTQEDEIGPAVLEPGASPQDTLITPTDSLKLESRKESPISLKEETPAQPGASPQDTLITPTDSLKLESQKESPISLEEDTPAQPEASQPDNESEKENTEIEENDGSDE
mgnify:CR=1 FL=1|tara:strand:+ start:9468 stop:12161 length:2694 start_codon:yes stop_codon:yes gene_type:complete